ncbi:MAG: mannonate dehydratase [Chloroflexi bacterium]|nr:mannonate dehydratase [Chloroflexota bacterium]
MMDLAMGQIHRFGQDPRHDAETLTFIQQLGIHNAIVHTPELPGDGYWELDGLLWLKRQVERFGLKLAAIECMPNRFYDKIKRGLPGRDEQIEKVQKTIRNMGKAGIDKLAYVWNVLQIAFRTGTLPVGRGGADVTVYHHGDMAPAPVTEVGEYSDEFLWDTLTYFLKAVLPVAEEAGVMLALHPDDPPVPKIAGVARIIRSVDAYKRVLEIYPSPSNGFEFCQGCIAEMCADVEEVYDAIRYFAERKAIAYVHFRNVKGAVPDFEESFIDDGKVDMLRAMRTYKEAGYDGLFMLDHTPRLVNDTPWAHRGRAYAVGYIRGLLHCVYAE